MSSALNNPGIHPSSTTTWLGDEDGGTLVLDVCVSECLECLEWNRSWTFRPGQRPDSPDVIGPQGDFQFSQDLGGLLNSPSEFLGRKIREGGS